MKTLSYYFAPTSGAVPARCPRLNSICSVLILAAIAGQGCSSYSRYEAPKASVNSRTLVPPPGMVYIPAGSISIKNAADPDKTVRKLGLSPFFIDETEVTNRQYRAFINWVADSIAVTDFLKDDNYFLHDRKHSGTNQLIRRIDWSKIPSKIPLWRSTDPAIQSKLYGLVLKQGDRTVLNRTLIKFRFSYYTGTGTEGGRKLVSETVPVMPDESVWVSDFPNSQMTFMAQNYFNHFAFDNHPVIGVTWKQARAYTYWRSIAGAPVANYHYLRSYQLTYSLPTEAQWQYAASGSVNFEGDNDNSLLRYDRRGKAGRFMVNFKQQEGDYVEDGSIFTLPVKSYAPNSFGVFNMAGNVSEWTLDAFSPSAAEFVHDLNPVLLYDAADNDPLAMKRKVVRGGSWKDNADLLNIATRNYEIQDIPHSYIGFRCVMPAPELISSQVRTRKRNPASRKDVRSKQQNSKSGRKKV